MLPIETGKLMLLANGAERRAQVYIHGEAEWTAAKVLRRMTEHLRDHYPWMQTIVRQFCTLGCAEPGAWRLRRRTVTASLREMSMRPSYPLRALLGEEELVLQRTVKASSERVDVVKRAKALFSVQAGQSYTEAAQEAGYKSGDSVSQLVERFNQRGLAALQIASGRGRKETYTGEQRACILAEVQRMPDREKDGLLGHVTQQ